MVLAGMGGLRSFYCKKRIETCQVSADLSGLVLIRGRSDTTYHMNCPHALRLWLARETRMLIAGRGIMMFVPYETGAGV
jgi:hypothetical protein